MCEWMNARDRGGVIQYEDTDNVLDMIECGYRVVDDGARVGSMINNYWGNGLDMRKRGYVEAAMGGMINEDRNNGLDVRGGI